MIRDIIWDFDGTLFDTYPATVDAFRKALEDIGIEEKSETILDYLKISEGCAVTHFKELYGLKNDFTDRFAAYKKNIKSEAVVPFPFAEDACRQLVKLGGRNYIITHRGDSTLKFLEYYGMVSYFAEIVTKQYGFKRKPDPEAFLYLVEKYRISKDTALVIGDREYEILAGKAAGIKTCFYNTNHVSLTVAPDLSIDSLEQLIAVMDE